MSQIITTKRAYEPAEDSDGFRVYVDRLWPRGLSHATFHYDLWNKDVAPSNQLREWFHANPQCEWVEFEQRYRTELSFNPALATLRDELSGKSKVTLLYSSHDTEHNNAIVLRDVLLGISNEPSAR